MISLLVFLTAFTVGFGIGALFATLMLAGSDDYDRYEGDS